MSGPTLLEQRLSSLIDAYRKIRAEQQDFIRQHREQEVRIQELEAQNQELRLQIDELNTNRFNLKRYRDERKVVRRKVETALQRLEVLEQEVTDGNGS